MIKRIVTSILIGSILALTLLMQQQLVIGGNDYKEKKIKTEILLYKLDDNYSFDRKLLSEELINNSDSSYIRIEEYKKENKLPSLYELSDLIVYENAKGAKYEHVINPNVTFDFMADLFVNKTALYEAFFSDYYFFLVNNYQYVLDDMGIHNCHEFLEILNESNFANNKIWSYTNALSSNETFLVNDKNGFMEDQPETSFVGYCYRNGKYLDVIKFFELYFYYWRLAERTASIDNSWADFYSDKFTALVDVYKFFYYNETDYETTWSSNVHDCFVNIQGVVGKLNLKSSYKVGDYLPSNITRRGYVFDGWYLSPDFTGNRVYKVPNQKDVTLYAKWVEDYEAIDKYNGEYVNMYLYNLSTKTAEKTSYNISKVRELYFYLSSDARQYCIYKDILWTK